jgi:hypothetical protein
MLAYSESSPREAEAMDFFSDALARGPRSASDVKAEASAAGITPKPLRLAKEALGVKFAKPEWLKGPGD